MQQPGQDPVPIGLNDAVNIINQQMQKMKEMSDRIEELEKNPQKQKQPNKNVSFSENIIQPSVHAQQRERDELEKKIQQLVEKEKLMNSKMKQIILENEALKKEAQQLRDSVGKTTNTDIRKEFQEKPRPSPVENTAPPLYSNTTSKTEPEILVKIIG
jgi:regulator of replication initiation timing